MPTSLPSHMANLCVFIGAGQSTSNGGKLLIQLVDATDAEMTDVAGRLAKVGVDAEVGGWDSRLEKKMAIRYLNLVPLLVSR
ncbi:hypothetical protein BN1708_014927 [Verticillium longisporum]|uniref:Uncharacterized protein n=1 Tax=Verticillium longisporum TaxID=100787 RepID=A0A0G4M1K2_VERLO|nr:hypothetical protein BN1708_014927 [Verticillium longisporum]